MRLLTLQCNTRCITSVIHHSWPVAQGRGAQNTNFVLTCRNNGRTLLASQLVAARSVACAASCADPTPRNCFGTPERTWIALALSTFALACLQSRQSIT